MTKLKNESDKSKELAIECKNNTKEILIIKGHYNIRGAFEYIEDKVYLFIIYINIILS